MRLQCNEKQYLNWFCYILKNACHERKRNVELPAQAQDGKSAYQKNSCLLFF